MKSFVLILYMSYFWNPAHIDKQDLATFETRAECEAHLNDFPMCHWTNKSCVCSEVAR